MSVFEGKDATEKNNARGTHDPFSEEIIFTVCFSAD